MVGWSCCFLGSDVQSAMPLLPFRLKPLHVIDTSRCVSWRLLVPSHSYAAILDGFSTSSDRVLSMSQLQAKLCFALHVHALFVLVLEDVCFRCYSPVCYRSPTMVGEVNNNGDRACRLRYSVTVLVFYLIVTHTVYWHVGILPEWPNTNVRSNINLSLLVISCLPL